MTDEKINLDGLKVLLGISGGIAAYKSVDLASKLCAAGAAVKTVMTAASCELVRPKSFEAITGQAVYTNLWSPAEEYRIGHISLVDWADVIVVAPATADIIAKAANGICDDLLSTVICASWQKKIIFAPAMNDKMWTNPIVQRNVKILQDAGFELIGPVTGRLACGAEGPGRMAEVIDILKGIAAVAKQ